MSILMRGFLHHPEITPQADGHRANQQCHAIPKVAMPRGRIIKLITVQEILDEQHVQKM